MITQPFLCNMTYYIASHKSLSLPLPGNQRNNAPTRKYYLKTPSVKYDGVMTEHLSLLIPILMLLELQSVEKVPFSTLA